MDNEAATWEDLDTIHQHYPNLEDKVVFDGEGYVTNPNELAYKVEDEMPQEKFHISKQRHDFTVGKKDTCWKTLKSREVTAMPGCAGPLRDSRNLLWIEGNIGVNGIKEGGRS